jgi:HPr kinase/phosphorylase
LYGIGSVRNSKRIDLIVNFKEWQDGESYDRLGLEQKYTKILDVDIATLDIPVKPGRNLAIILEAAARNHKQKLEGYNAAEELDMRLQSEINS